MIGCLCDWSYVFFLFPFRIWWKTPWIFQIKNKKRLVFSSFVCLDVKMWVSWWRRFLLENWVDETFKEKWNYDEFGSIDFRGLFFIPAFYAMAPIEHDRGKWTYHRDKYHNLLSLVFLPTFSCQKIIWKFARENSI